MLTERISPLAHLSYHIYMFVNPCHTLSTQALHYMMSGLNINILGQIENGQTLPSVSPLQQLAGALGRYFLQFLTNMHILSWLITEPPRYN